MTCLKAVFNSWSAIDRALLILHRIEKEEALRLGNKTQGNGANWFDIVGCQVGQSFTLVSLLGIFNTALKRNVVSSTQMALITFTPVLLQGARRISTKFSRRIDVISSCWGSLCLVADAVLLVAIFWLGNRVYPVVLLSVLGFGYLQKKVNGIALAKIQKWYLPVLKLGLSPLVFFMQKNFFLKQSHLLSFVFDLGDVAFVYKKLFSSNSYFYKDAPDLHLLNLKDFLSILQLDSTLRPILGPCKITLSDVVVNKEHVRVIPFPIVPEPLKYFTSIEDVWNSLKWKGDELIEKITGANREIEFKESKKEPQVYAKDLLDKLLRSIKDEAITTAAPLDYYMLKNQLGFIGKELKDLPEESTELKKTILLQLALEGAGVCGTGVYEQVETAANTLLMLSPVYGQRLTLKQRILIILHSLRRGIFENMYLYHQAIEESVIMRISGKVGDPHNKSVFLNVFASDFGLFDEGAQNDLFNPSDFWVKKLSTWWYAILAIRHLLTIYGKAPGLVTQ
jgi:ATP-dependent Clp protease adapter protein ClpS